jgi:hypothetical protein
MLMYHDRIARITFQNRLSFLHPATPRNKCGSQATDGHTKQNTQTSTTDFMQHHGKHGRPHSGPQHTNRQQHKLLWACRTEVSTNAAGDPKDHSTS